MRVVAPQVQVDRDPFYSAGRQPRVDRWRRLPGSERGVDFPPNPACGERREARLGATGLGIVVEFVPPFPDIRFGGGNDRELDALVEQDRFLVAKSEQRERD